MTYLLKSLGNPGNRRELFDRLARLDPEQPPRWGRLTAPRMLAHLCDQMRLALLQEASAHARGPGSYPVIRELSLYLLPWPRAKIQGPPEAFDADPAEWSEDMATLRELVDAFLRRGADEAWPDHPHFGRMSQRSWSVFCYRHFDHHLRQFGV